MASRSNYKSLVKSEQREIYIIDDYDDAAPTMSVTNDVDNVVADLSREGLSLDEYYIVYRDTEGRWDGILTRENKFLHFVMLDARERHEAMKLMREKVTRS